MKQSKIDKLNELEFEWYINGPLRNGLTREWLYRYEQLNEYKDRFGHRNVPHEWEENPQLASWVFNERSQYHRLQEGKMSFITEDLMKRFQELQEYKDRFGNCDVPHEWEENPQLGRWVHHQRQDYRKMTEGGQSAMTEERIEKLSGIGFRWCFRVVGPRVGWDKRFGQLVEYKDRFGHCRVPLRWKENPQLGMWVNTQRQQYSLSQRNKKSNMTEERVAKLNGIEFSWRSSVQSRAK